MEQREYHNEVEDSMSYTNDKGERLEVAWMHDQQGIPAHLEIAEYSPAGSWRGEPRVEISLSPSKSLKAAEFIKNNPEIAKFLGYV